MSKKVTFTPKVGGRIPLRHAKDLPGVPFAPGPHDPTTTGTGSHHQRNETTQKETI